MPDAKRLLILCRHPAKPSFRYRVGAYLEPLRARGLHVETQELDDAFFRRRRQLRHAASFDAVWLQKKTLTFFDALALRRRTAKLIYDFDDAIMFKTELAESDPDAIRLGRFRRTVRLTDLVIAGNGLLASHAHDAGARRVIVIPTGLNASLYQPPAHPRAGGPLRLVWIGSRSTLKQIQPFVPIFEAIGLKAPGTVLRIIADAPLQARHITVENVPWSSDTETALLADSDIGIAPLPDTPFTRGKCAFKIVQYMAARLPVIASPVGVNADYVRDGQNGFCPTDQAGWLAAFDRLASDPSLRASLGLAGRQRVERELDFSILAPRLCDAVEHCLEG